MNAMTHGSARDSLAALLARRARATPDGRLAIDAAVGLLVVAAALQWRPPAWPALASAALCVLAFGLWGIADREWGEASAGPRRRWLATGRTLAALLGAAAAVALLLTVMAALVGTWIS